MSAPLEIVRVTIDEESWTAIVAPFPCSRVSLRSLDETYSYWVRTDQANANTEDLVPPLSSYDLAGETPEFMPHDNQHRARHLWKTGDTVIYIKAVTGTGPIVARFKQ